MPVEESGKLLSPDEERALLPLKAKWEKELASVEVQLTTMTNRKSELTRMLASLNGILPSNSTPVPAPTTNPPLQRPTPLTGSATAAAANSILTQAAAGRK